MGHTRPIQILWFVGAAVFILALFHTFGGGKGSDLVSNIKFTSLAKTRGDDRVPLKQFVQKAEGIWSKTVRQRIEMRKDWDDQQNMPFFPAYDGVSYHKTPYSIWDFVPASYSCPYEMERIGRMGDGGKWVCGMSLYENIPADKPCIIYSFGVQTESSFENEMLSRTHCKVWAYDFSVVDFGQQLNASYRDRAQFKQVGISGETDTSKEPPYYSIQDLMKMNGHDYLDILKLDIEFAEFASLSSLSHAFPKTSGLDYPIGQMMVELHLFAGSGITSGQFLSWWEALEDRGMRATWTEPNLLAVTGSLEDKNPRLAEYTLLNTKDARSVLLGTLYRNPPGIPYS